MFGRSVVATVGLLVAFSLSASGSTGVELVLPRQSTPVIEFGAREIAQAIRDRFDLQVRRVDSATPGRLNIFLHQFGKETRGLKESAFDPPASSPESFTLSTPGPDAIVVAGRDGNGVLYGALELAEQIRFTKSRDIASGVRTLSKSPFLSVRGVNMFLTVQDLETDGAFWSDEFWNGFLDMLARSRYNLLDIHGLCDAVILDFPNTFSYFVSLPDFPQVGVGPEKSERNLERLRRILKMAADRGLKVAYMNYEAPAIIGERRTGRYGVDERWIPPQVQHLQGQELEEYTRQAVSVFLKKLPELWMFGFRIGESGQPEDFYKRTYLSAVQNFPGHLNLYVRTWIGSPEKIRELAAATPHRLFIEPKYNGEHLGLPYQAVLGGRHYPPSGSYEDYTANPKNYSILWQIRAHGTHRVFYWGWPEFARRTVRSCKLGDGVGFSLEPMDAYCPAKEYLHHNPKVRHDFYTWMYERQWLWHLIWGRTAYDPEVSDDVFASEFARRFGPQVGQHLYQAAVEASKIVPFVFSYHNQGLDHQEFTPELETGDHALASTRPYLWQGDRKISFGGTIEDFLTIAPLDRTAMEDPASYVERYLKREASGKMGPLEAAAFLDSAAEETEKALRLALEPARAGLEFDCLRRDLQALISLGRYYRDRILSATHFAFYRRTSHHPELSSAYTLMQRAIENWDRLSEVADEHYGFITDTIRPGVNRFRWREEGRSLANSLEVMDRMELEFRRMPEERRYEAILGHVPPREVKAGQDFVPLVTFATGRDDSQVWLFYRTNRSDAFTKRPMALQNRRARTWMATIPSSELAASELEYFFQAQKSMWGPYGSTLRDSPPFRVRIGGSPDFQPQISHQRTHTAMTNRNSVELEIEVRSPVGIRECRVYYKPLPAFYEWLTIRMDRREQNRYQARVPLTAEGMQYYFEIVSEDEQAVNYPNFLKETPYLVIDSWMPSPGSAPADRR
ncbi:MAG: hypothetical protein AB1898_24510 [Acidobacteriota bacterium]